MAVLKKGTFLGEILVSKGVITKHQLEEALRVAKRTNSRIGNVLVKMGYATEKDIAEALAVQYNIPSVILSNTIPEPEVLKLVPESIARRFKILPLSLEGDSLKVAMLDPLNVFAIDELKKITGRNIQPMVSTETEIMAAIDRYYAMEGTLDEMVKKVQAAQFELLKGEEEVPEKLEKIAEDTSVVQLVNLIISKAVLDGA